MRFIEVPENWEMICTESNLPEGFNVWYYFFQELISKRAEDIITKKVSENVEALHTELKSTLTDVRKLKSSEVDLRWYLWSEESSDMSRTENKHLGTFITHVFIDL